MPALRDIRFLLLFLFLPVFCSGQFWNHKKKRFRSENSFNEIRSADDRKNILKASVISFVDQLSFPTVQFGLERKISDVVSLAGEFGYQFYQFKRYGVDTTFTPTRGIKANIEIRYYDFLKLFHKSYDAPGDMKGVYAGLNFFYRGSRFNNNVFYKKPNDTVNSNDCYWVKKSIWGVDFVLGIQKRISQGVMIDLFSGLGGMYRVSRNFEREYNQKTDFLVTPIDVNARAMFNEASLSENNGWVPSFNIGVRIGIRL